ncbi:MAG: hypothetical protein ACK4MG_07625 [Aquabacterium sp.]|nr:hypothetical protein [uncultured Aquabacterium sp.]
MFALHHAPVSAHGLLAVTRVRACMRGVPTFRSVPRVTAAHH